MPRGALVLHVATQHGEPFLWALVDPTAPVETRGFIIYGTGHDVTEDAGKHLGSFLIFSDSLVFHVFEVRL